MGIEDAKKLLDDLRDEQREVSPITNLRGALQENLHILSMPITFHVMYKILDALAEPDKIEKGTLKIPKGVPPPTPAKESPAFGVGDIVEFEGHICRVDASGDWPTSPNFGLLTSDGRSLWASHKNIKLLFPLSRVPKELELPNGWIIRLKQGDILELVDGKIVMSLGIVEGTFPYRYFDGCWMEAVGYTHQIKRVVWKMEVSK